MKHSSRKLFISCVLQKDMRVPLKTLNCGKIPKLPSKTTQNGLNLPVPTKYTIVIIFPTGDCPPLPPNPSCSNQSILIKSHGFHLFHLSDPNLIWNTPTWKAQRIIFTSLHGMKHKRNTTWFGHFPHSAVKQISCHEGKKQSGQDKIS